MFNMRINYISTWDMSCGIAEYSNLLVGELNKHPNVRVRVIPLNNSLLKNPFEYIKLAEKAGKNCDIVHIQYQPSFFKAMPVLPFDYFPIVILILRLRYKVKIVLTIHELRPKVNFSEIINLRFIAMCDLIILHDDATYKMLLKNNIVADKIVQIPHGTVVGQMFDKNTCKNSLDLTDKKVMAIFGFIHPDKGHDLLIKSMPLINKDIVLLVLGTPHINHSGYYKILKNLVSQMNLESRVRFHGFVPNEELPLILNAVDLAIFPYRWINISGALHLVLGYKVPVIASDLDYFKEVKMKYDCIEIVEREDYQRLAQKIQKLLSDNDAQYYLRKKCIEFIECTNWAVVASQTRKQYLETIAGHHSDIYNNENQMERISWLRKNKDGNTLEIGCATGFVTNYVGADVGLDIREDRLMVAREAYPCIQFVRGDGLNLPFKNNLFRTVMLPDILEHVPVHVAYRIIMECMRICANKLLITLPNADKKGYKNDPIIGGKNPEHLWSPDKKNVKFLFDGLSYEIEYSQCKSFLFIKVNKM